MLLLNVRCAHSSQQVRARGGDLTSKHSSLSTGPKLMKDLGQSDVCSVPQRQPLSSTYWEIFHERLPKEVSEVSGEEGTLTLMYSNSISSNLSCSSCGVLGRMARHTLSQANLPPPPDGDIALTPVVCRLELNQVTSTL